MFKTLAQIQDLGMESLDPRYSPDDVVEINDGKAFAMPVQDIRTDETYLGVARAIKVNSMNVSGGRNPHLVVLAKVPGEGYVAWCGDAFLENKLATAAANTRLDNAVNWAVSNAGYPAADADNLRFLLSSSLFNVESSARCNFWTVNSASGGTKGCKHLGHVLTSAWNMAEVFTQLDELEAELLKKSPAGAHKAPDLDLDSLDPIDQQIEEDLGTNPCPIMLIGESGASKTFRAQDYARRNNLPYFEIGGNSDVRPTDLTGHYVKMGDSTIWMDGVFTEAIRAAQHEKVVFGVDEIFRMEADNLSFFLSRLNPRESETPGQYRYHHKTGFLVEVQNGRGKMEEISCPVENLLIIASTNLGSQYGIMHRDPAIRRRFREIEVPLTEDFVKKICGIYLNRKGWDLKHAVSFGKFWQKMRRASKDTAMGSSLVAEAPNLGVLSRAIMKAKTEADIPIQLEREILQWVGTTTDGYAIAEQVADVKRIIKSFFK